MAREKEAQVTITYECPAGHTYSAHAEIQHRNFMPVSGVARRKEKNLVRLVEYEDTLCYQCGERGEIID
jgi:hypothetical protein